MWHLDGPEFMRQSVGDEDDLNKEPCGMCVRKRSTSSREFSTSKSFQHDDNDVVLKERRQDYLNKRRSTLASMRRGDTSTHCQCRSHRGALRPCVCASRRKTISPKISESELMEKETKLVVLEFLRGLTTEQIRGRSRRSREGSTSSRKSAQDVLEDRTCKISQSDIDNFSEALENIEPVSVIHIKECDFEEKMFSAEDRRRESKRQRASTYHYNTVTIGERDHRDLLESISSNSHSDGLHRIGSTRLGRSRSDISEEHYAATRAKLQQMQAPVRKWFENNTLPPVLKREIIKFKKDDLKSVNLQDEKKSTTYQTKRKNLIERKNLQPLRYLAF